MCERCEVLEKLTFELWNKVLPHQRWMDAETALAYLAVEVPSIRDHLSARLDEVEALIRADLKPALFDIRPVMERLLRHLEKRIEELEERHRRERDT